MVCSLALGWYQCPFSLSPLAGLRNLDCSTRSGKRFPKRDHSRRTLSKTHSPTPHRVSRRTALPRRRVQPSAGLEWRVRGVEQGGARGGGPRSCSEPFGALHPEAGTRCQALYMCSSVVDAAPRSLESSPPTQTGRKNSEHYGRALGRWEALPGTVNSGI